MSQHRKVAPASRRATAAVIAGERPYSARSVIASTLLGTSPPRLSPRRLVRVGELFGIAEGTIRVAVSRMVGAGELVADDGGYRLTGRLLERQARQQLSRRGATTRWAGRWRMAVVVAEGRSAPDRSFLREAMRALRMAELREGFWLRPHNLPPDRLPEAAAAAAEQCELFLGKPETDPAGLASELWDLGGWADRARLLLAAMDELLDDLEAGEHAALAPGFEVSAAVLRHLGTDPLLPRELVPSPWPASELRGRYDRYDRAYRAALRLTMT